MLESRQKASGGIWPHMQGFCAILLVRLQQHGSCVVPGFCSNSSREVPKLSSEHRAMGEAKTELAAPQAQHWDVYPQASLPQSALYDAVHYKPAYCSSEIFPFIQKAQK